MQHDVFGFNITVNDTKGVDFIDCLTDLFHEEGNARLR